MEVYLLAIRARFMLIVGVAYLAIGFYIGTDPATLAWRTALAALIAVAGSGWLLHRCSAVIEERMASDIAERQLAAEQLAQQNQTPAAHLQQQMQQQQQQQQQRRGR